MIERGRLFWDQRWAELGSFLSLRSCLPSRRLKSGLPERLTSRGIYAYGICGNCGERGSWMSEQIFRVTAPSHTGHPDPLLLKRAGPAWAGQPRSQESCTTGPRCLVLESSQFLMARSTIKVTPMTLSLSDIKKSEYRYCLQL